MAVDAPPPPVPVLRDAVLVVALAAVLMLPPVGHRLILTSHEARFALIARDMLTRHAWFGAEVRGEPYRNKPPLHPWAIAAASWWKGRVGEASARLPGALATVATVLAACLLAERLFGGRAGLMAGLVMATSYGVFAHSQMILPDLLMIAFGVFAGYFFWRAVTEPGRNPAMMRAFYATLALGVFSKGPAGLLPLAVAAAWLTSQHGVSGLRKLWSLPGALIFSALTLVWAVPFATSGTSKFAGNVLWSDWAHHYLRAPRPGPLAAQILELAGGFLPWTLLVPLAFAHAGRGRSGPAARFAIFWFAVQFVLIMASTTQRVRYLLSIYPGLALLVAWWAVGGGRRRRVLVTWTAAGMAAALCAGVWIYNGWINATHDFDAVATALARHAGGQEAGVFVSKGEYLQIDYYLGRDLKNLGVLAELEAYVAAPRRPAVVVNQEAWERHQGRWPAGLQVLETVTAGGETLRIVRLGR